MKLPSTVSYELSWENYQLKNVIRDCLTTLGAKMVVIKVPSNFHMDDDKDKESIQTKFNFSKIDGDNEFQRMCFYIISVETGQNT